MEKLTVIIPAFNEAHNMEPLLKQVAFADEIIVIDSYSTDDTAAIAEKMGANVVQRTFDNFSAQKNHAIALAKNAWILLVDADERVGSELQNEVVATINSNTTKKGFWIYRTNFFMEQRLRFSGIKRDKVLRLFRKEHCQYNGKLVHEEIECEGETGFLKNRFEHYSYRDFGSYIAKLSRYARLQSIEYNQRINRVGLFHFVIKPAFRFCKHYLLGLGILDGIPGLVYAFTQMYAVFARYVYVWHLRHNRP
jgi:glycosyltransferase involved in cell wall biosynthesis